MEEGGSISPLHLTLTQSKARLPPCKLECPQSTYPVLACRQISPNFRQTDRQLLNPRV